MSSAIRYREYAVPSTRVPDRIIYYTISTTGTLWRWCRKKGKWRKLHGSRCKSGHLMVRMGGVSYPWRYIHHLVLESFVGPCPEGMECCHEDNNPANNRLSNLRWGTRHSNVADRIKAGKHNRGSRNGQSKLDEDKVRYIRRRVSEGASRRSLAAELGVRVESIGYACKDGWRHVT